MELLSYVRRNNVASVRTLARLLAAITATFTPM